MFCMKCGTDLPEGAMFCNNCGNKVEAVKKIIESNKSQDDLSQPTANNIGTQSSCTNQVHQDAGNDNYHNTSNSASNTFNKNEGQFDRFVNKSSQTIDNIASNISKNSNTYVIDDNNADTIANSISPLAFSANINTEKIKRDSSNEHPYTKLGGFLAFIFYGGLVGEVLSALGVIISIIVLIPVIPYSPQLLISVLVYLLIGCIFIPFAFRFLAKIKNKEVDFLHYYIKLCIWFLIFWIPGTIIIYGITISQTIGGIGLSSQYAGLMFGSFIVSLIINLISFLIPVILLCVYFCKSVRVRTYIGTDKYLKLSKFTKNVTPPKPLYDNDYKNSQFDKNFHNAEQYQNNSSSSEVCSKCGSPIKKGNSFCTNCGNKVS